MEPRNRRNFLKKTALGATALAMPLELFPSTILGANDRLNLGLIGCNGMGWSDTLSILKNPDVKLIGLCDVDQNVLDRRLSEIKEMEGQNAKKVKTYADYRELLDNKDIDIVIIGTPDHWHCKIMVDACEAGKQVYVEKPIANTIEECQIMVQAAKKYNTVVQVGQWQRSGPHYKKAIEIVQSGQLGKIRLVKVWAYQGWMKPVPVLPNTEAPKGVDYKQWLGPAPTRPFNANRFHFNFRWFWDYAGGLMTDWGVHEIDIALYAMKALAPKSIMASGGKLAYPDDASETPDTLQALYEYGDFNMQWEHATGIDLGPYQKPEGIAFIGNNATLVLDRGGFEVLYEKERDGYNGWGKNKIEPIASMGVPEGVNYLDLHTTNFVAAVRANDPSMLNTHIESGSVAAINAQMGNIAYKTGEKLYWNAQNNNFGNNEKANALIKAQYHNGYKLPNV